MRRFLPSLVLGLACVAVAAGAPPTAAGVLGRLGYPTFLACGFLAIAALASLAVASAPPPRRRPLGLRFATAGLGIAFALGAFEAASWLLPPGPPADNPFYLSTGTGVDAGTTLPFERPAHLDWTGTSRGDLAVLAGDDDPYARVVSFRTDADGFRNDGDVGARARVVFLGDSHTEAGNVPIEDTFVQRVEAAVGRSVRNLGRAGTSPSYQLEVLRRHALPSHPDVVVWQVTDSNDLGEEVRFQRWVAGGRQPTRNWMSDPDDARGRLRAWKQRSPSWRVFRLLRRTRPWPKEARFTSGSGESVPMRFLYVPAESDTPERLPGWRSFASALGEGRDVVSDAGADLWVLFVPMKLRVLQDVLRPEDWVRGRPEPSGAGVRSFPQALAALCARLGVPLVDPTVALVEAAQAGERVYQPYDTHLSSEGHAILAREIETALDR